MHSETDSSHVASMLATLSSNLDTASTALQPLISRPLSTSASKLPLLDRAKLYIHAAYAVESLLFAHLQLSGVEAKSHPVFDELKRVKAYFGKIKDAEGQGGPRTKLDKGAAGRMIRAGLAGHKQKDKEETEEQRGQKRKVDELVDRYGKGNRFGAMSKRMKEDEEAAREEKIGGQAQDGSKVDEHDVEVVTSSSGRTDKRKHTRPTTSTATSAEDNSTRSSPAPDQHGKRKKKLSHAPKDAHQAFQKLLGKSKTSSTQNSSADEGSKKRKSKS